ncbi:hypothetical protein [Photobacterium leiognathi]|uniref:hypothetical protein n=1 Tax=Photobacterium leiognathi TaxID=553611 RepID=UPI002982482A|nr:hypothetical protein [Photobacterium leiognathi]
MEQDKYLLDDRFVTSEQTECDETKGCYCNCHFTDSTRLIGNTASAVKSEEESICESVSDIDICDNTNTNISFNVPTEPAKPVIERPVIDIYSSFKATCRQGAASGQGGKTCSEDWKVGRDNQVCGPTHEVVEYNQYNVNKWLNGVVETGEMNGNGDINRYYCRRYGAMRYGDQPYGIAKIERFYTDMKCTGFTQNDCVHPMSFYECPQDSSTLVLDHNNVKYYPPGLTKTGLKKKLKVEYRCATKITISHNGYNSLQSFSN